MERQQDHIAPTRKGQKRKLEDESTGSSAVGGESSRGDPSEDPQKELDREVRTQVEILDASFSWREADRSAAKRAAQILAELAKNGPLISLLFFP